MEPTRYQIWVRGLLSERLAAALDGMTLHSRAANTVFTGEVKDQSQLYGLLDRLRDLGLELISVQPEVEGGPGDRGGADPGEGISRAAESALRQPFSVRRTHRSDDAAVNNETQS